MRSGGPGLVAAPSENNPSNTKCQSAARSDRKALVTHGIHMRTAFPLKGSLGLPLKKSLDFRGVLHPWGLARLDF